MINYLKYAEKTLELKGVKYDEKSINKVAETLKNSYLKVYKAVAFDVDGTLTKRNSVAIDEEMSLLIGDLLKKGVHVLLISGRGRTTLKEAAKEILDHININTSYIRRLSCIAHNGIYLIRTPSIHMNTFLNTEELLVKDDHIDFKELRRKIISESRFKDLFEEGSSFITEEPSEHGYMLRISIPKQIARKRKKLLIDIKIYLKSLIHNVNKNKLFLTQAVYGTNYLFNISTTDKTKALKYYAKKIGVDFESILRIGDQGQEDGNDYDLLNSPSGFSVDSISNHIISCFPVLDETSQIQLKGVEATKMLLDRLLLFPPLSLEPNNELNQLQSLHEFEELAILRAKKESILLLQKLKIRIHRLLGNKDDSFDFNIFSFNDLFDQQSGGVIIKDWEVRKINHNHIVRKIFDLEEQIFTKEKAPNLKWAMFTDTGLLMRGPFYYYSMRANEDEIKQNVFFQTYLNDCKSFIHNSRQALKVIYFDTPSFVIFKFLIAIFDNIRNILINFLYASYLYDCSITSTKEWNLTKKASILLEAHTQLYINILLNDDYNWKNTISEYEKLLNRLPSKLAYLTSFITKYQINTTNGLIRRWREADNFLENYIAVNIGLHEFSDSIKQIDISKKQSNTVIGLGLVYGGIELPIIATLVAKLKNIKLISGFYNLSLYGNEKTLNDIWKVSNLDFIEDREHESLDNIFISNENYLKDIQKRNLKAKNFIILDDNCTTCRTLELARNILIKNSSNVLGAIIIRYPGANRFAQMRFNNHGLPDPDILLSYVRGFVAPSPYSRIFHKGVSTENIYKDKTGIFDKSRHRITRYLDKNEE